MNIFDVIGPVMIGPSSSHTAGASRLGRVALRILDDEPVRARIGLVGSFAQTYKGHGTDKALIAGILNMGSADPGLRTALDTAAARGLDFAFETLSLPGAHPNTAVIELWGRNGRHCRVVGASIGGGNIAVTNIDGMEVAFTGQYNTLVVIHNDVPGTIAVVTQSMASTGLNIGSFRLSRPHRGGRAVMTIEVDGEVKPAVVGWLKQLPNILNVVLIRAI